MNAPDQLIPVGVVIERRKAKTPWVDYVWRPAAILPGQPNVLPWSELSRDGESTSFYAGPAHVALFGSDTAQYRDNLGSGAPKLWVALRPTGREQAFEILIVTADPSEGELRTEAGADLVDAVAMPQAVQDVVLAFVDAHHVDRPFFKRVRTDADPEALARRPPDDD